MSCSYHLNPQNCPRHSQEPSWPEESPINLLGYIHRNIFTDNPTRFLANTSAMTERHALPKGLPDWSSLEVIHRNTLPPRASFLLYDNPTDALTRDPSKSK